MKPWDIAIIGGGILGTCTAYWLSSLYEGRIAVYEQEGDVAMHASGRNTGVVHRPFYLHPVESRLFARASLASYDLWRRYAEERGLPWRPVGTLKLALQDEEIQHLETYMKWAEANGLEEGEVDLLDQGGVRSLEPNVKCKAALHAKKETAVDFGAYTRELRKDAEAQGVRFLLRRRVVRLSPRQDGVAVEVEGQHETRLATFVINCAGGDAVDLAHSMGVGLEYTDLHFRGEYWKVVEEHWGLASRNVYPVPRYAEFPFLDPHWIVRATGEVEIGPSAVPVDTSSTYDGFAKGIGSLLRKMAEYPMHGKARLAFRPKYLGLTLREVFGSMSPALFCARVRRFLPPFNREMLARRGSAGIRSSLVDGKGRILKEVVEMEGPSSIHVLNYNSPGATGAPAYTASLVRRLKAGGLRLDLQQRARSLGPWDFEGVSASPLGG